MSDPREFEAPPSPTKPIGFSKSEKKRRNAATRFRAQLCTTRGRVHGRQVRNDGGTSAVTSSDPQSLIANPRESDRRPRARSFSKNNF